MPFKRSSIRGSRRKPSLYERARAVPAKRPIILALVLSAIYYLALVGAASALVAMAIRPGKSAAIVLLAFLGLSGVMWLVSFLKRRGCRCPLCQGTPLVDSGAHRHQKAVRFFPLNHGSSNVVRALLRQHFRCQYCGTPFDLLKAAGSEQPAAQAHAPLAPPPVFTPLPPAPLPPAAPLSPLSPPTA